MSELFQEQHETYLQINEWEKYDVMAGFSTRKAGVSKPPYNTLNVGIHVDDNKQDVLQNRQYIASHLKKPLDQWKCLNQVHSTRVLNLAKEETSKHQFFHENPSEDADGMITNHPEHLLVTYYADCVPLYFIAPKQKWIGLAHAGWRGTVSGIGREMVNELVKQGVDSSQIQVAIGPCISQPYYEVDDHVINQIPQEYHTSILTPSQNENRYLLDLKELNFIYLQEAGILKEHVSISQYCTYRDQELFYSFRRDHGLTGRMMAFISLK
ncbi:peptidoglycan editing factor PgeF [Alkalibacillus aidingensis]|uniref:peptidoglycan editing factor PgeF n=1 Tax=Alkalibacillus aidingensis TaxID=2747607 RepID=UPI0016616C5F|nr:peptidoglycan editing factor PgeF [Alkalibacillus aidingensis]